MDLESENSALESSGDNDLVCSANPLVGDDVKIELNGSFIHDDGDSYGNGYPSPSLGNLGSMEIKEGADKLISDEHDGVTVINSEGKGTETDQHIGNSPLDSGSKGKALRKWRRIRREVTKDGSGNPDVTKILKRGSAFFANSLEGAADMKQKSEGSVSSTNAFVNNPVGTESFSNAGSSSVYKVVGISAFSVGTDSDNSEDRSSKSSTAASIPKSRYDQSRASGHSRDKHKLKHMGKKSSGNSTPQKVQHGSRQLDNGKKPRNAAVSMDKENSLSSLESDSRNYCSPLMQGPYSAVKNGHSGKLMGSDGDHSDDEPPNGPNGSVGEGEEASQVGGGLSWQISDTIKNHELLGNKDPLVDCVQMLQSVQEALEQEILKFGDLGKDIQPLDDELFKDVCKDKLTSQAQKIKALKKQLEETMTTVKEKESKITELEATLNNIKSSSEDLARSLEAQQKKYNEIEAEIEVLYKQKTEAEIKYLAIAEKQAQEPSKTGDLESITGLCNDKADEEGISRTGIKNMKNGVTITKLSSCFFIQLILFGLVLEFFLSMLPQKSEMVMPT